MRMYMRPAAKLILEPLAKLLSKIKMTVQHARVWYQLQKKNKMYNANSVFEGLRGT